MRTFTVTFVVLGALLLTSCRIIGPTTTIGGAGGTGGGASAAVIKMGASSFVGNTTLTVKVGSSVKFDDSDPNAGTHILVAGTNGAPVVQPGAPDVFMGDGDTFNPGDKATSITFPTAGTYTITCTIHPTMLATITVQ